MSRGGRTFAVALSGGVASGKSEVAKVFRGLLVPVFDADVIARDVVRPNQPALAEIVAAFGDAALTPSGELDRIRMRQRIFADAVARQRLEAIIHPRVRSELFDAVAGCRKPYCLLVIPLLVEVRVDYDFVNRVLLTDVSPEVQITRLTQRDLCGADEASQMIAAQAPRNDRLALADDVIDNDGDASALVPMVERLDCLYLRHGRPR
jgi:dephospho-CoA kinase